MPSSTGRPAASASSVRGTMPRPGDDRVEALGRLEGGARPEVHSTLAVVVGDEACEPRRERAPPEPLLREHHGHVAPLRAESGGDLGADEASADDEEARALVAQRARAPVVGERAEVDDVVACAVEAARRAAGREHEALVGVLVAGVVEGRVCCGVDGDDAAAEHELGAVLLDVAPDLRLVPVLPEALRQRRTLVRRKRLLADEPDRSFGVGVVDAVADGVAGHAGADDEIAIGAHCHLLDWIRTWTRHGEVGSRRACKESRRWDSNPQPSPYKCAAPPIELLRQRTSW